MPRLPWYTVGVRLAGLASSGTAPGGGTGSPCDEDAELAALEMAGEDAEPAALEMADEDAESAALEMAFVFWGIGGGMAGMRPYTYS